MSTVIIAIDSSFGCTGISLCRSTPKKITVVDYTYITEENGSKSDTQCARVFRMASNVVAAIQDLADKHLTKQKDFHIAIEDVFYNRKNPKSTLLQARLIQAIEDLLVLSMSDEYDFIIVEYNPKSVKKAVFNGNASKEEVQKGVKTNMHLTKKINESLEDISKKAYEGVFDSMAIAFCHHNIISRTEE